MPGHSLNHFTGKTRPANKQRTKKKRPKIQKPHINKYAVGSKKRRS